MYTKIIIILVLLPVLLLAQFSVSLQSESAYTTNAFNNYKNLADTYSTTTLTVYKDVIYDYYGFRFFYSPDYSLFQNYSSRSSLNHSLGTAFYKYFGENGTKLSAGYSLFQINYGKEYEWYNRLQDSFYLNSKIVINNQLFAYIGTNVNWYKYKILDDFSNRQWTLFIRGSKFFDSGTSLVAEMDYLQKKYITNNNVSSLDFLPEIETTGDGSSEQFVYSIKVGQALWERLGMSLQYLARKNGKTSTRYLGSTEGFYYSDEEILNDVFGYESTELSLKLKKQFLNKMSIEFGARQQNKNYNNRYAMDLEGNVFDDWRLREDSRLNLWVNGTKSFKIYGKPFSINSGIYSIKNSSNDEYYDYTSLYYTLGIRAQF